MEVRCRAERNFTPGAEFAYAIDGSTASLRARALPAPGARLRFAAFGDSGQGSEGQLRVAAALERLDPDLVLLLGDIVYQRGRPERYRERFFAPYARTLARVPFFPAPGNHDYGNHYLSRRIGERRLNEGYRLVFQRPKYYSFDAGDAHFASLDTNRGHRIPAAEPVGPGSAQLDWLERDLAASKARWKFVFLHVPLYSSGKHGDHPALAAALEPILARHGVDVVFQGHDHHYERTRPIRGVVYVTSGAGGGGLHPRGRDNPYTAKRVIAHGVALATVEGRRLTLEFVDADGRVQDRHQIEK